MLVCSQTWLLAVCVTVPCICDCGSLPIQVLASRGSLCEHCSCVLCLLHAELNRQPGHAATMLICRHVS